MLSISFNWQWQVCENLVALAHSNLEAKMDEETERRAEPKTNVSINISVCCARACIHSISFESQHTFVCITTSSRNFRLKIGSDWNRGYGVRGHAGQAWGEGPWMGRSKKGKRDGTLSCSSRMRGIKQAGGKKRAQAHLWEKLMTNKYSSGIFRKISHDNVNNCWGHFRTFHCWNGIQCAGHCNTISALFGTEHTFLYGGVQCVCVCVPLLWSYHWCWCGRKQACDCSYLFDWNTTRIDSALFWLRSILIIRIDSASNYWS